MATHRYTLLDVFTATPLEGNGLAVVHDADDLDDATMLAFARETRLSETTFVQTATAAGADYRNRIWTVEREIPFAGHPSLGTAVAVARAEHGADHVGEHRYVQQTGAGEQPIDVRLNGQDAAYASMLQEPPVFGPRVDQAEALAAIGLAPGDGAADLQPQIVSTGAIHLMLPLNDRDAVARATPDYDRLAALLDPHEALILYAAALDPAARHAHVRGFAFSAAIGEDPATGSAAGPLCAYLDRYAGQPSVTIDQGVEMGRRSRLDAAMEGDRPRVGGHVVAVVDGTLRV
jgi:trans-2,3-dihydro-3-hydroxyanthranilate isomerase